MKSLSDSLAQGAHWYDSRPVRERVLILLAILSLVLLAGWQLAVAPVLKANEQLSAQITQARQQAVDWQSQQTLLAGKLEEDPNARMKSQLQSRRQRLASLDQQLAQATDRLISPKAMVALLRNMLAAQQKLKLVKLEVHPPVPVYSDHDDTRNASSDADRPAPKPLLYAHDVVLTTEGAYLDLLGYLQRLENLDQRLGWRELDYKVETFPTGKARIRVRTLSLDKAWLGV